MCETVAFYDIEVGISTGDVRRTQGNNYHGKVISVNWFLKLVDKICNSDNIASVCRNILIPCPVKARYLQQYKDASNL